MRCIPITVSPEEAYALMLHQSTDLIFSVTDYCRQLRTFYELPMDLPYHYGLVLSALWNAGRIQGIREERARRKETGSSTKNDCNSVEKVIE